MKIDVIAVDIDGTITDHKRRICISAIKAIRKAEEKNIPVILVTGNVITYAYATAVLIGCSGGIVCENGGVIFKEGQNNDQIQILTDKNHVNKANKYLTNKLGEKLKKIFSNDNHYRKSEIVYYKEDISKEIIEENLKDFDDFDKIEVYDSGFALHLTDKRVNKGSSLKYLCNKNNINIKNLMAIGDSENDIEFLKVAGFKVAVANADNQLKKNSDYICQKSYGNGVKEAIDKFVL